MQGIVGYRLSLNLSKEPFPSLSKGDQDGPFLGRPMPG
jgi:hypothetical protein